MCFLAHNRSDCGNFATHPLEFDKEEAQVHKDTQHMNTCTALYELRIRSVNKVEALTLSLGKSHDKKNCTSLYEVVGNSFGWRLNAANDLRGGKNDIYL
jgi:hypothetical protein